MRTYTHNSHLRVALHLLLMLTWLVVESSLLVDKYSIHNLKFLSLSIIVDGAKLLCFNVCIYSTKVEVLKLYLCV